MTMPKPSIEEPPKEVEFKVKKEDWSKYEILDGKAVLWVRAILVKLFEAEQPKGGEGLTISGRQYGLATNTVSTAFFDRKLRGGKTELLSPEAFLKGGDEIEFTSLEEPWNEYIISGKPQQLLKMKCVVTGLWYFHSDMNDFGDPILRVNSQVVVSQARDLNPDERLGMT